MGFGRYRFQMERFELSFGSIWLGSGWVVVDVGLCWGFDRGNGLMGRVGYGARQVGWWQLRPKLDEGAPPEMVLGNGYRVEGGGLRVG